MEAKWKIEGYHKDSLHLLIERDFKTEIEARDFGRKLRNTNKIVPILFEDEVPVEEIK